MRDNGCASARGGLARTPFWVWLGCLAVVLSLSACESLVASGAPRSAEAPLTPSPTVGVTVAATLEESATVTSMPSPTLTATVTPPPTATPEPFLCPQLNGTTERGALQSQAMGEEVRFIVHLPPCYSDYPQTGFPVLYLLHGWPLTEAHWMTLGAATVADDWVSRGIAGPFILVLPGASSDGRYVYSSGGDGSFEGMMVNELVPLIDQSYRTVRTPAGRAIGGISRGGVWSLEIALRNQGIFGSVGAHSPALALNNPLPQYDPFLLIRESAPQIRIYLDAGDLDWARASTLSLFDKLVEVGADVRYDVHTGGHVDDLWKGGILDYMAFYTAIWPTSYESLPAWAPMLDTQPTDGLPTPTP